MSGGFPHGLRMRMLGFVPVEYPAIRFRPLRDWAATRWADAGSVPAGRLFHWLMRCCQVTRTRWTRRR